MEQIHRVLLLQRLAFRLEEHETSISVGNAFTCAIMDDASAYCWGVNSLGQVGDGSTTTRNTPGEVDLPSGRTASTISSRKHIPVQYLTIHLYIAGAQMKVAR